MKMVGKKLIVIVLGFCLMVIAIRYKQNVVKENRERPIVSSIVDYKVNGKPVYVKKIQKSDVDVIETFTAKPKTTTTFEGYVTKDIIITLHVGQKVLMDVYDTQKSGKIIQVEENLDVETGLYLVRVKMDEKINTSKKFVICHAFIKVIKDVINIDNEHAQYDDGEYYAWIIAEGKAYRKHIKVKSQNDYGLIVDSGIKEGDVLVLAGQSKLNEGDKVKIVNN